jgi:hypothetical protein
MIVDRASHFERQRATAGATTRHSSRGAAMWMLAALLLAGSVTDVPIHTAPHVRATTPGSRALLTEAVAKSSVLNMLIGQFDATDIFVYIEITGSPDIPIARTKLVTAVPTARFLRVTINAQVAPWDRLPLLAHELQHALEIAADPDVRDDDGIRRLFQRVGFSAGEDKYETTAAREVERRVRVELARLNARPR